MDAQVTKVRPITIAIVALGGEGGGVLADWIVDLAQHGGYLAQATSVPGVAQRTGATVYYVELFPKAAAQAAGREPVLGLLPMPGDVDVVLASELMEAARAVERGFVTPERTLLITSTHRVFAMTERIALADGRVDSAALFAACREAARQLVAFDMEALADASASVISAMRPVPSSVPNDGPTCVHEALSPRLFWSPCSIDSNTAPAHSPPSAIPCTKRSATSKIGL